MRPVKASGTAAMLRREPCEQYRPFDLAVVAATPLLLLFPDWLALMWFGIFWMLTRRSRRDG
jgi:hypothetical protein